MSDALFQIEEPQAPSKRRRSPGWGIGIDLGTTHSLVASAPHGAAPRVLLDEEGRALLPSVVSYAVEEPVVGEVARASQLAHPEKVLSSVKRFMGRGLDDIDFHHPYRCIPAGEDRSKVIRFDVGNGRVVSPVEVSAEILATLKRRAEAELGGPVDGAVITVPAYFDDAQRQATKDAGRIAGLQVYRLLAEPTAAALAYGLDRGRQGYFAVYDLGGGTFDISILRLRDGVFQVLATGGDSALGGDDLDRALAGHLLKKAGIHEPSASLREEARVRSREAKEQLSEVGEVEIRLESCGFRGAVSRPEFESVVQSLIQRTAVPCRQALKDAGLSPSELDGVVLVGGSTRVPAVRRIAESVFRCRALDDIDPDKVVAYGAAIQADILSGSEREGVTLLDVVPLSLGIETMGGIVEKLIPRNATIPIGARQVFTNYSEQQTGMVIHVVQGERELADDCRSLARFELKGIPRLPPSMARVEVSFQLDADALLTVTARELMTGIKQTVEVRPTYGLSDDEVDALVMESLDHAEDDYESRNRAEARVEMGRVILAVRTAMDEVGHLESLLPPSERSSILQALADSEAAMAASSAISSHELQQRRQHLERVSEAFARRRMERALQSGMGGKSLSEIEASLDDDETLEPRRGSHSPELQSS